MAVNFGQMKQRIKDDVNRPSSSNDTAVSDSIVSAIRFYNGKRLWFLEDRDTLTLLQGDSSVALPDDFQSMIKLRILRSGFWYSEANGFKETTYEQLLDMSSNDDLSTFPEWWAIYNGRIYFNCKADADYDLDISYIKGDVTMPSSDGDASVFFEDGQDLIRYKAEEFFYSDFLHDSNEASVANAKAQNVYNGLIMRQNYKGGRNVLNA